MHLKRQEVPKSWPIPRKGKTFVVRPQSNLEKGIPLLIVLRDMLKIIQNRKEAKKIIHEGLIFLNTKIVKNEKTPTLLFDTLNIPVLKKYYRINLSDKGKFGVEEITESETTKKIAKIIGKKVLNGKRNQINLSDGNNILADLKCSLNDSVLINLKEKKIEKHIPLKEKTKVIVFGGKHSGEIGIVEGINNQMKMVELSIGKKKLNVLIKQIMCIE
jgi:small subunit ribosomal protein S4e